MHFALKLRRSIAIIRNFSPSALERSSESSADLTIIVLVVHQVVIVYQDRLKVAQEARDGTSLLRDAMTKAQVHFNRTCMFLKKAREASSPSKPLDFICNNNNWMFVGKKEK